MSIPCFTKVLSSSSRKDAIMSLKCFSASLACSEHWRHLQIQVQPESTSSLRSVRFRGSFCPSQNGKEPFPQELVDEVAQGKTIYEHSGCLGVFRFQAETDQGRPIGVRDAALAGVQRVHLPFRHIFHFASYEKMSEFLFKQRLRRQSRRPPFLILTHFFK